MQVRREKGTGGMGMEEATEREGKGKGRRKQGKGRENEETIPPFRFSGYASSVVAKELGWEERLQNDIFCVE